MILSTHTPFHRSYVIWPPPQAVHFNPEEGGSVLLQNIGIHLHNYAKPQSTRLHSIYKARLKTNEMKQSLQSPTFDTKLILTLLQQPVKISQKSKLFTICHGKLDYVIKNIKIGEI